MLASRRSKLRKLAKRVFIALGLVLLLGGGTYIVWFSPYFQLEAIDVEGAVLIDEEVIAGPAGGNILFWKLSVNENDLPQLASIAFKKDFINRRVVISVQEREKFLIWCLHEHDNCFWTDENGFIFTKAPVPEGAFVISVVRDYTNRNLNIGDNVLPDDLFVNLDFILELLHDVDIPIDELRIDDLKFKEATVTTSGGPEIYFSLLFNPRFGEGVLDSLKTSSEWGAIRYVDLRVENRAYYSL